jgi:hypothetical protein
MIAGPFIEIRIEDIQNKKRGFLPLYRGDGYIDRDKSVPYMP